MITALQTKLLKTDDLEKELSQLRNQIEQNDKLRDELKQIIEDQNQTISDQKLKAERF